MLLREASCNMTEKRAVGVAASLLLGVLLLHASASAADEPPRGTPPRGSFDLLVFAPHPDDEVLGCAGVILQALADGKRVGVVVLTNGDGYPKAAAVMAKKSVDELTSEDFDKLGAIRQGQSLEGAQRLGLPAGSVMFLGYPDSALAQLSETRGAEPLRQKFTRRNGTYGAAVADYHSLVHGSPAPYTRAALLGDVGEIIAAFKPAEIYVTHEVDAHADHKAAYTFVREAAQAAEYRGRFYAYVVHGQERPELPVRRVPLTAEQVETKKNAIRAHQIPTVHDTLVSHAGPEEVFWVCPLDASSTPKSP
jgi:LmbE family N-acetylglucosaminyl deacetylase